MKNAKEYRRAAIAFRDTAQMITVHIAWARMHRKYANRATARAVAASWPANDRAEEQARVEREMAVIHYRVAWSLAKLRRRKIHLIAPHKSHRSPKSHSASVPSVATQQAA